MRPLLALAWPPALAAAIYLGIGRLGFFPTDEGLLQAYGDRILHGQVPHRDFISVQPLGSAIFHLVEFAIPGPLFEVGRVVALCEYVAYAILLAWLVYAAVPWRWSPVQVLGVGASVLVNMNIFPLMGWYTVDGVLLVSIGLVLISTGAERESWRRIGLGFLVIGCAALTKQSFVPAAALGWVLFLPRLRRTRWPSRIRELVLTGLTATVPSLLFVAVISGAGGFSPLRTQLVGTAFVYGRPLLVAWSPRHDFAELAPLVALTILVALLLQYKFGKLVLLIRLTFSTVVVAVPLAAQFGAGTNEWGVWIWWMALACCAVRSVVGRTVDVVGAALIGLGWMSSLSYGYPYPNFVGGSLGLYLLYRTWATGEPVPGSWPGALAMASATVGLILISSMFLWARTQHVYFDRPADQLTASLHGVSPAFGDIRTNPHTAQYLTEMRDCVTRYPARDVAILPENAAIYPALSLHNPFPIDWLWPDSMHGSEARILSTVDVLNRDGDYVVMFQTIDVPQIVGAGSVPDATPSSSIAAFTPVANQIYDGLNGSRSTCGPFLVVYSPPTGR